MAQLWKGLLSQTLSPAIVVGCLTIPHLIAAGRRLLSRRQHQQQQQFQDADGTSSPESLAAFNARVGAVKTAIAILCVLNVGVAILTQQLGSSSIVIVIAWALVLVQGGCICAASGTTAFNLGLCSACCCLGMAALSIHDVVAAAPSHSPSHSPSPSPSPSHYVLLLPVCQALCASALAVACIAIPNKPALFDQCGRWVDTHYMRSLLEQLWFVSDNPVIVVADRKGTLDGGDLGRPAQSFGAASMLDRARRAGLGRDDADAPFWTRFLWANRRNLAMQTCYGAVVGFFLYIAPAVSLLGVLEALEARRGGHVEEKAHDGAVWLQILGLYLVLEAGSFWTTTFFCWDAVVFAVPAKTQLAAIIFDKSLRVKDTKAAAQDDDDQKQQPAGGGSGQNVANLISIDANGVADGLEYMDEVGMGLSATFFGVWYLTSILGWRPFLAAIVVMVLVLLLNTYVVAVYTRSQSMLMRAHDAKLAVVSEALAGIRQIKFDAAEDRWEDKIQHARREEMDWVRRIFVVQAMLVVLESAAPILLTAACYAAYAYFTGGPPSASATFASNLMFTGLVKTATNFITLSKTALGIFVSLGRIGAFLKRPEFDDRRHKTQSADITFSNATVAWPAAAADEASPSSSFSSSSSSDRFVLAGVNVTFPRGGLSLVSGKTGMGKSLVLAAILGEAELLSGSIGVPRGSSSSSSSQLAIADAADAAVHIPPNDWLVPHAVAYVPQRPWIENASIAANICFGSPLVKQRLDHVIDACALRHDIDSLHDGQDTEIGVNGINLSGGQKWRLMLARAVYSRAGILILDDIFSAVDIHVGKHILDKCLAGPLCSGRTKILATHHVPLCISRASYVVGLADATVKYAGPVNDENRGEALARLLALGQESSTPPPSAAKPPHARAQAERASSLHGGDDHHDRDDEDEDEPEEQGAKTAVASSAASSPVPTKAPDAKRKGAPRKFVEEEARARGSIAGHVYAAYFRDSGGWWFCLCTVTLFVAAQVGDLCRVWWLSIWTNDGHHHPDHVQPRSEHADLPGVGYYLGIYVALIALVIVLVGLRSWYLFSSSLRASNRFFARFNRAVLRAPMRWLDTTPVGRILNRYTGDFSALDTALAPAIAKAGTYLVLVVSLVLVGVTTAPLAALIVLSLSVLGLRWARSFLALTRPTRRLQATSQSIVVQTFLTALEGVATIRASGRADEYMRLATEHIDDWAAATNYALKAYRWLGVRLDSVAAHLCAAVAVALALNPATTPAFAGFSLSLVVGLGNAIFWALRVLADVEQKMTAAERVVEYADMPVEFQGGRDASAAWPTEGRIEVSRLVAAYASDLPPVLRGLTFTIAPGERVGVVGRTGAGKSSLTMAIFRFLDVREGAISIDGVDISTIKARDLRSRLAIIPQDPVLFSGTVRSNLDPSGEYTDAELISIMERVCLASSPPSTPPSAHQGTRALALSTPITEGGLNLSHGQRQLMCLGRAIISRPKIIVLDEATSAVDTATDTVIQASIRREFASSTLVVIAHRLSTVADFDRVLVMESGRAAEFGAPADLWRNSSGVFRAMCDSSGDAASLREIILQGGRAA